MKKKDYILIGVVALFLVLSFFLNGNKKEDERGNYSELLSKTALQNGINELGYDYFEALVNASTENVIVYLGSSECSWCSKFKPILEEVVNENNLKVVYINMANVSNSEYTKIKNAVESNFSGTPTTLIMNGSTVVDALGGYTEKENVVEFFKTNGFIK